MPSACEGFGLPAVEAAACGAPVIATRESPLPELLEGGGVFVRRATRPRSTPPSALLTDDLARARMARSALARARALSTAGAAPTPRSRRCARRRRERGLKFRAPDHVLPAAQLRRRRHRHPAARARAREGSAPRDRRARPRRLSTARQNQGPPRTSASRRASRWSNSGAGGKLVPAHAAAGRPVVNGRSHRGAARTRRVRRDQLPQHLAGRRSGRAEARRRAQALHGARALARLPEPRALASRSRAPATRATVRLQNRSSRPPQAWRHRYLERELRHVDAFIAMSRFSRDKHTEFGFRATWKCSRTSCPAPEAGRPVAARPLHAALFPVRGRLRRSRASTTSSRCSGITRTPKLALVAGDGECAGPLKARRAGSQREAPGRVRRTCGDLRARPCP
ncbi:MAG: hypothetical protein IPK12_16345 [Gemmatimonadetes bacterium]|nr:hypothetical protein [Gemmatimonadota bacterium]